MVEVNIFSDYMLGLIKLNNNMKHRKVIHSLTLTSLSIVYDRKHVVPEDIHNPPTELEGFFRPIYTLRLCCIQQAYDKLTTGLRHCKRVVGLIYTKRFML